MTAFNIQKVMEQATAVKRPLQQFSKEAQSVTSAQIPEMLSSKEYNQLKTLVQEDLVNLAEGAAKLGINPTEALAKANIKPIR